MKLPLTTSRQIRKLRHNFGIASPRLVVRRHWPLGWVVAAASLVVLILILAVWDIVLHYEVPRASAELAELREEVELHRSELGRLRAEVGGGQSVLTIERVAQRQLLQKVEGLERENAALKEDIRLFERLVAAGGADGSLRIEGFQVAGEGGGRYRYRLFVAHNPERQGGEFRGRLQLSATYVQVGEESTRLLVAEKKSGAECAVSIRHFQRCEGSFELPQGGHLKGVEAQILQGDLVRARGGAAIGKDD